MIKDPTENTTETIEVTIRGTEAYRLGVLETERVVLEVLNNEKYKWWYVDEVIYEVAEVIRKLKQ